MKFFVTSYDFTNQQFTSMEVEYLKLPRKCPHCNQTGVQGFVSGILIEKNKGSQLFVDGDIVTTKFYITTCCYFCEKFSFHIIRYEDNIDFNKYRQSIDFTFPKYENLDNEPPQNIKDDYPDFYNIWKEATKAKNSGLHNLAGMGYRKSIEFLTTDYLLKNSIEGVTEDWITSPKTTLMQKILKLDKPRLVTLGKAIAYLGNDETHYTRIHEDYSIDDLINFIDLFISEIESDLKYKKAEKLVNRPKK